MSVIAWLKAQKFLAGIVLPLTIWLNFSHGLLVIIQAWCISLILAAVIFENAGLFQIKILLLILLGIFILRAVTIWYAERSAFQTGAKVRAAVRDQVFRHLQTLGPAYLANQTSGALVETLTKGIDDLEGYYARYLPAMTLTMLLPLAILAVVLPIDWLTGLVFLITAPLIPLFMILIGSGAEARNQRQWKQLTRMGAHFLDVIQGLTTLKLFGASARELDIISRVSEEYRSSTMQVLRIAFLSAAVLELFASWGIALVAILIGLRLYHLAMPFPKWLILPELGFQKGIFILLLTPEFYAPLRNLGTQYHARLAAVAAAEQLMHVLDTSPVCSNPGREPLLTKKLFTIRFEKVSFAYEANREVLKDFSCLLESGSRVALVGASGAGKTTVLNLLLGFLAPSAGRILIAEQDLAQLDLADWRRHLAWVPQTPRLFAGTIAENICLGMPDASFAALRQAAQRARADEFITALPDGYASKIGEKGAGLSGGQIQRIALARAFLRDAPLILLDEATASLDPESEFLVQEGIAELAQGRTVLMIAHRLVTVQKADLILVLDHGQIIEAGNHQMLLQAEGRYADMVAALI